MTNGEIVDWAFRGLFAVLLALWGRSQKQTDDLMSAKADGLARLAKHDREALQAQASEAQHNIARLFESELSKRDQRMAYLEKQLEDAADRASTAATKLQGKMGEIDLAMRAIEHRVTVVEERVKVTP